MEAALPPSPRRLNSQSISLHSQQDLVRQYLQPREADGLPSGPEILHEMRWLPLMPQERIQPFSLFSACIVAQRLPNIDPDGVLGYMTHRPLPLEFPWQWLEPTSLFLLSLSDCSRSTYAPNPSAHQWNCLVVQGKQYGLQQNTFSIFLAWPPQQSLHLPSSYWTDLLWGACIALSGYVHKSKRDSYIVEKGGRYFPVFAIPTLCAPP